VDVNPYQAPTAAPLEPPPANGLDHHYVDQAGRVRLLTGLLLAGAALSMVSFGSTWLEMDLLERAQRGNITIAEAEANDARQGLIAILAIVAHLVTIVIFAMFLVRANKNARAVSGQSLEVTPAWMVWWFCIPFANLFKPYVAVREVWEHSKGAVPPLFGLWWGAWVLSGILGQIVWRMTDPNDSIPELLSTDRVVLAGDVVDIASALLALWMVRSLHAGQQRHHQTGRPDLAGL
jgi:hypothetical protein